MDPLLKEECNKILVRLAAYHYTTLEEKKLNQKKLGRRNFTSNYTQLRGSFSYFALDHGTHDERGTRLTGGGDGEEERKTQEETSSR